MKLTAWVGSGRPVTAKGVLRPADLPAAAAALGVQAPAKVRTAADVPPIHWPWVAAEAAGLIEVGTARAVARKADGDPPQLWLKGLDAVLRTESQDANRHGALTLCRAILTVLANGHEAGEEAVSDILDGYDADDASAAEKAFRQGEGLAVEAAVALLSTFGAIEQGRLTDLGRWAREQFDARAPEAVTSDLPVADLLARLAPLPEEEAWRQALRWFGTRRPVDGAARMLHAAEFAAPVERVAAVDVVAGFADEVLPAWRSALRYRNLRAHALAALADWDEGPGIDETQRRWLVTEYALSTRARRGVEDAYHYVRDRGGLDVVAATDHPGAGELHEALRRFAASARIRVHQLKLTRPPLWWRVQVPACVTLGVLHEIVQVIMISRAPGKHGRDGEQVHAFDVGGLRYSDPFHGLAGHRDEHEIRLSTAFPRPGRSLKYRYGAEECQIACERILDPGVGMTYPRCVALGEGDRDRLSRDLAGLAIPQP